MGALPGELALTCRRPAGPAAFTLKEKRSEFIAALFPAATAEEARACLESVRREHRQASHNCPAWRVGFPAISEFSSDDGEPAGTAGRPILGALQRAGLSNAVVIVTRYFGGVKLGVRGLIDAYSAAAAGAVAAARAETAAPFRRLTLRTDYGRAQPLTRSLRAAGVDERRILPSYAADVRLDVDVELSLEPRLRELLAAHETAVLLAAAPEWGEDVTLAAVDR